MMVDVLAEAVDVRVAVTSLIGTNEEQKAVALAATSKSLQRS